MEINLHILRECRLEPDQTRTCNRQKARVRVDFFVLQEYASLASHGFFGPNTTWRHLFGKDIQFSLVEKPINLNAGTQKHPLIEAVIEPEAFHWIVSAFELNRV